MDRERKTLAEFSRAYLRSLDTPVIHDTALDGDNGEGESAFAACVVVGMKRARLEPEPRNG
jgi:hypothetical protein